MSSSDLNLDKEINHYLSNEDNIKENSIDI